MAVSQVFFSLVTHKSQNRVKILLLTNKIPQRLGSITTREADSNRQSQKTGLRVSLVGCLFQNLTAERGRAFTHDAPCCGSSPLSGYTSMTPSLLPDKDEKPNPSSMRVQSQWFCSYRRDASLADANGG